METKNVKLGKKRQKPKLLSPIKSYEGAVRVVNAGADELYCGVLSEMPAVKDFVLHRGASTCLPSYDELGKVVKYAHVHDVKVIVATNMPFMVETFEEDTKRHIRSCLDEGADALIVGDPGILSIVKRISEEVPLYASTYMATMNYEAVDLLRKLGFSRVILEEQCTISEISEIVRHSEIEIEVFIHGAGCSNFILNCYLMHFYFPSLNRARSMIYGFNSPCMLPYDVYDVGSGQMLGEDVPIVDAFTFCSLCHLPELIQTGVTGFKIVGRGKTIEYQERTTRVYRELIDLIASGQMQAYKEKVESLRENFIPLPPKMGNLSERCCEQKRCFYSPLFQAPYKTPLSWHACTKLQLKQVVVEA